MRKIIQIACSTSESANSVGKDRLYALCDDGTLFSMKPPTTKGKREWEMLEPVPQPKEKQVEEYRGI